MATALLYFIVAFIVLEFGLSKTLSWLNLKSWNQPLAEEVKNLYDAEKYAKARNYAKANFQFGILSATCSLLLTVGFLVLGGFAWVDGIAKHYTSNPVGQALIFFALIGGGSFLLSLPFACYDTFVIEEKFGFNKTTPKLFVTDKLKNILLAALIGGGILALLTFLFGLLGNYFWLAGWLVAAGFSLLMAMFYTTWLLLLFNKLTPLEDGDLRRSIESYAAKARFPLTNIFVLDGSKRSAKANAFFSGLGHKKNIVLYDTLLKDLSVEEITSVLAHEVGHYKKKHIAQSMALSIVQMGIMFFLFGLLAGSPLMAEVLGAKENNFHLSLVAFSLIYAPVSLLTGLLMNLFSRKNEYEADAYAKESYGAEPLISSLKKLSVNHLSNLQPHPAYVFVNFSHPTLLQRIRALRRA